MSKDTNIQIILEEPECHSGVYVIFNPVTFKAYVGEGDVNTRISVHITGIFEGNPKKLSNDNLCNEPQKTFDIIPVIDCYYKKNKSIIKENDWITHETIVMYVLRKYGIELYNGNQNYQDNIGKERKFLLDPNRDLDTLLNTTVNYLKQNFEFEYSEYKNWNELIEAVDGEIRRAFENRYNIENPDSLKDKSEQERRKLWQDRYKSIENTDNVSKINKKNYKSKCKYLKSKKLFIRDLEYCGLKKMDINSQAENGKEDEFTKFKNSLDRVVFSKFGDYSYQSPITILKSKTEDIKNNKFCFWAIKRLNEDATRKFLLQNNKEQKSRYVIMPYTSSKEIKSKDEKYKKLESLNPSGDESFADFGQRLRDMKSNPDYKDFVEQYYVKEYTYKDANNKKHKEEYPDGMIPSIISKGSSSGKTKSHSNAFKISDFFYLNVDVDNLEDIYSCFYSVYKNGSKNELAYTYGIKGTKSLIKRYNTSTKEEETPIATGSSTVSNICAEIKEEEKKKLINLLESNSNSTSTKTILLIAKLAYPYIVSLS